MPPVDKQVRDAGCSNDRAAVVAVDNKKGRATKKSRAERGFFDNSEA
jgi:hypothetical protein